VVVFAVSGGQDARCIWKDSSSNIMGAGAAFQLLSGDLGVKHHQVRWEGGAR